MADHGMLGIKMEIFPSFEKRYRFLIEIVLT